MHFILSYHVFLSFSPFHFELTATFRHAHQKNYKPQMTFNTTRSNVPHIILLIVLVESQGQGCLICVAIVPPSPINSVNHFHSVACCFRLIGHFEKSVRNDPKMTLSTTMSKAPNIWSTSTLESQISLSFAVRFAICKIWAISHFPVSTMLNFNLF